MFANKLFVVATLFVNRVPSSLGFQCTSPIHNCRGPNPPAHLAASSVNQKNPYARTTTSVSYRSPQGQEWISKSVEYYTTVMRKEKGSVSTSSRDEQSRLAKRLYHAIQQVRSGNLSRAENIYRKTIRDINEDDSCSNAELATTTLLLALVLQRMGNIGEARMVFHRFFRTAVSTHEKDPFTECSCTGKVLGAYALFEMKYGSVHRSIEVARRASQFDGRLSKLFDWKQFRDAEKKTSRSPRKVRIHHAKRCSFVAEANLPSDAGDFRLRAYRVSKDASNAPLKFAGTEPSVIYYAAKPPLGTTKKGLNDVPIQILSPPDKIAIFKNERCKYKEQLELSLQYIQEHGGAIIYFEQEAQSTHIAHGVAATVLQTSGFGKIGNLQLGADVHCSAIPSVLDDMGIESIRLVSNSPSMVRMLRGLGVDVRGTVPLVLKSSGGHEDRSGVGV